ncbi:MAG: 1-acyl-sn-glycerol-3-phosphate acyltransferase [Bacteroidetes bacterium]|nr:1-acyl-sn-glycerol-3-phosphate acyltransferase [Bacteroidota bacterium]
MLEPVQKVTDWPILKISKKKDQIIEEVIEDAMLNIEKAFPKSGELREIIARTLYLEKIRIKHEAWKVDPPDESKFWDNIKKELFESDPAKTDKEHANQVALKLLREIVTRYTIEITGNFNPRFYKFAKIILPHFFSRMLNASNGRIRGIIKPNEAVDHRLTVDGPIEKIRKLSQKGTLILLPTHFSNLDSILIGFGMDKIGLSAFQYGAGLNLFNSKFFGFFMGNLGAYKLDRRKKNPIYLETLKSFSKTNVVHGAHTLFFPGGTRSRSGAIETRLKLGLLGTVVEAQRVHFEQAEENGGEAKKIFIVPLTMSYHFVLEAKTLIEEHLKRTGKEFYITIDDEFSSLYKIYKFFWQTFAKSSDITLSLGDPIDIFGNKTDEEGNSLDFHDNPLDIRRYFTSRGELKADHQREMEYTHMLGDVLVKKYKQGNVVFSSHVVAFVAFELLKKANPKSDLFTLLRSPEEDWEITYDNFSLSMEKVVKQLRQLERQGQLKLADHMNRDVADIINHGIKNIGIYHSKEPLMKSEEGSIISQDIKLLLFYHNRMEGYGLSKYV